MDSRQNDSYGFNGQTAATCSTCPGCGGVLLLAGYGLVDRTGSVFEVVCRSCGNRSAVGFGHYVSGVRDFLRENTVEIIAWIHLRRNFSGITDPYCIRKRIENIRYTEVAPFSETQFASSSLIPADPKLDPNPENIGDDLASFTELGHSYLDHRPPVTPEPPPSGHSQPRPVSTEPIPTQPFVLNPVTPDFNPTAYIRRATAAPETLRFSVNLQPLPSSAVRERPSPKRVIASRPQTPRRSAAAHACKRPSASRIARTAADHISGVESAFIGVGPRPTQAESPSNRDAFPWYTFRKIVSGNPTPEIRQRPCGGTGAGA